jgi:membrane-bound ClpP family serine protease
MITEAMQLTLPEARLFSDALEKYRKLMAALGELLIVAAFIPLFLASLGVAQAAQIFIGGMAWTGLPAIKIYGQIVAGDEQRFAVTAATRQSSVVVLNSPGGDVDTAIAIGRMVRDLKFDTFVGRGGSGCWSACPLIWLSGRHAIVQRNSDLGFHAANVPAGTATMAQYLTELGLTPQQIRYILSTPQPDILLGTEKDARALGFHWQTVPSLFGGWRSCQAKYCVAVP